MRPAALSGAPDDRSRSDDPGNGACPIAFIAVPNTLCPYCVRMLTDDDVEVTGEHVFPQFLGGRAEVPACKKCNNRIGSDIEGPLSKPPTLMAMQASIQSGKGPLIRFEHDGRPMELDLSTGSFRSQKPVERTIEGSVMNVRLGGSEEQVRKIVEGMAAKHGFDPEQAMAMGKVHPIAEVEAPFDLAERTEARLAAKVALAAGTWTYGDAFITSELAGRLRRILLGDEDPLYETIDNITDWDSNPLYWVGHHHRRCLMIALPAEGDLPARTLLLVHLADRPVPAYRCLVVYAEAPARVTMAYEGGSDLPLTDLDGFIAEFVIPKDRRPEQPVTDRANPFDLDPLTRPGASADNVEPIE